MKALLYLFILLYPCANLFAQSLLESGNLYSIKSYSRDSYLYQSTNGTPYIYYKGADAESPNAVWEFIGTNYNYRYGYRIKNVHTGEFIGISNVFMTTIESNIAVFDIVLNETWGSTVNDELYIKYSGTEGKLSTDEANGILAYWGGNPTVHCLYYISEVTHLIHELEVGASEWATLVLAFNAVIPADEGFKAYILETVDEGRVRLKEAYGILGANTPIVVNAPAGVYDFVYTKDDATVVPISDKLKGTVCDKEISPVGTAYVLSLVDDEVSFCKVALNKKNGKAFKNNANKAYLELPVISEAANISIERSGYVTSVSEFLECAGKNIVYDICGNRLNVVDAPGIYIVDGKKMLIKW